MMINWMLLEAIFGYVFNWLRPNASYSLEWGELWKYQNKIKSEKIEDTQFVYNNMNIWLFIYILTGSG